MPGAGGRAQAVVSRADASLRPPHHRRLRAVRRLGLHRHAGDRGPSWRAICYALSDTFALKLKTLEAMTLQSLPPGA